MRSRTKLYPHATIRRAQLGAALLLLCAALACSSNSNAEEAAKQEAREKEFQEMLSGVVLDGYFTIDGREDRGLRKEKYTIAGVSKLPGGFWTIQARIQYGDHDVTVPVPVSIEWAGDTPVISLTDATIPGLGTFTARVMFYRNTYSGAWWHGETGGRQFGRIVKLSEWKEPEPATPEAQEPKPE
jgi:FtsP/CotA-like multicopper oxidase with cupredoxin domain